MDLGQIIYRTWKENILFSVLLELTYRCNLDCFFCYNDLGQKGDLLTTEEYFRFFADLRDMQCMNLIFSGGEPLAHPDFFALGQRARELGFVVRIKSNGHALHGALARRVQREVDPFVIDLSLHGARAETHDRQTRVPGSFERLRANIGEMLQLGLRLKLNCTLTRWNEDEIEGMFDVADSFGVAISINPTVSPRDDGDMEPLRIAPSREAKLRLYRALNERAEAGSPARVGRQADEGIGNVAVDKSCGAGSSHVTIDPFGNVLPCVQWREPVANLHHRSIQEIWSGSTGLEQIRELTTAAKTLVDAHGPRGRKMGFCPGLAAVTAGNPLSVYPSAREQMEVLEQVEREARRSRALPVVT